MSIRYGLLALLERGPTYGYQLRTDFDSVTGDAWPLNIGQVYSTLSRLERDSLVTPAGEEKHECGRYSPSLLDIKGRLYWVGIKSGAWPKRPLSP